MNLNSLYLDLRYIELYIAHFIALIERKDVKDFADTLPDYCSLNAMIELFKCESKTFQDQMGILMNEIEERKSCMSRTLEDTPQQNLSLMIISENRKP